MTTMVARHSTKEPNTLRTTARSSRRQCALPVNASRRQMQKGPTLCSLRREVPHFHAAVPVRRSARGQSVIGLRGEVLILRGGRGGSGGSERPTHRNPVVLYQGAEHGLGCAVTEVHLDGVPARG